MLSHENTNCNPLAHSTRECHHTNLWNAKLFQLNEGLLCSFKHWWLRKEPAVMCFNWNVKQGPSQQVLKVTTFCMDTCFQYFLPLISRMIHHAVQKFSTSQQATAASWNSPVSIHALVSQITVLSCGQEVRRSDWQSAHYGRSYRCRLPVRVFSAATTQVDQTVVDAGCSKDAGPCIHQQSTRLL